MKEINPQNIGIFGDKGRLRDDLRVNLWNHTIIINVTSYFYLMWWYFFL